MATFRGNGQGEKLKKQIEGRPKGKMTKSNKIQKERNEEGKARVMYLKFIEFVRNKEK